MAQARAQGGIVGGIKRIGLAAAATLTFARLYLLPSKPNALPQQMRVAPAW